MSKKRVELLPNGSQCEPTYITYGKIIEIRDDYVIIALFYSWAEQLIPKYRFIKEDDKKSLRIGAKVKVNRYFNDSRKELLAYNAELTSE